MDIFIVRQFNWLHILILLSAPFSILLFTCIFSKRSQKTKDAFIWISLSLLLTMGIATFVSDMLTDESSRAVWLSRIPLNMCSANMILYLIVFRLRKARNNLIATIAFAYAFYVGSPGAILGAAMPPSDCVNENIFQLYLFTYYLKHNMIFFMPILFVTLGYYKPKLIDMLYALLTLLGLMVVAHILNTILAAIGGYRVNYFFTYYHNNNVLLKFFWNIIPIPFIYLLPVSIIVSIVFAAYYFVYRLLVKLNLHKVKTHKVIID